MIQEAQFTDKRVHLFKETSETSARNYCGLHERWEIWHRPERGVPCQQCQRFCEPAGPGHDGGAEGLGDR